MPRYLLYDAHTRDYTTVLYRAGVIETLGYGWTTSRCSDCDADVQTARAGESSLRRILRCVWRFEFMSQTRVVKANVALAHPSGGQPGTGSAGQRHRRMSACSVPASQSGDAIERRSQQ